jgi:TolA-binding protein
MARILSSGMIWLFCSILILPATAQTRDRQVNDLTREVSQLKRQTATQEERIAQLEKAVKALQERAAGAGTIAESILKLEEAVKELKATPAPTPIPSLTPPWHSASNWNLIKQGMSRAQVVEILGPPTNETSVVDTQTLYYTDSVEAKLTGSVTFVGDRVTTMVPPAF